MPGVPPNLSTDGVTDHIVVGDRVVVPSCFRAVRARFEALTRDEILPQACEMAYAEGVAALVETAGPAAGLTRLAWARLDALPGTDDCAHIALWWEAIAADGKLFTALDADLMLAPADGKHTSIALAGMYRPQPGPAGAGLDRAILRCGAIAAIGSFLDQVACALVHPAGTAGPTGRRP